MSNDCFGIPEFGIFDRPDLSIVFTLSIVTVKGTDEPKRFAVFGDGVQIPNDWHPDPRAKWKQDRGSEPDKEEALNHDPVVGGVVNAEMQRIFDAVTSEGDEIEDCLRYWNEKHSGYFAVQVGRCDVGYPGFTETRMALINLRLSDLDGGDEDDYHMSLSLSGSVEA